MRGTTRAVAVGAATAALVLLAGCGGEPGARPSPSPRASGSVAPTSSTLTAAPTVPPPTPTLSISVPPELRQGAPDREILGADISWPQCPPGMGIPHKRTSGSPLPLPTAKYVVLGLTNGPGFTPNPCLASQVSYVKQRHLMAAAYAVASYPSADALRRYGGQGPYDAGSARGRLQNVGYSQALYNVATMKRAGLTSPIVWIDVEPVPFYDWSSDLGANAAVVQGAARGYQKAGYAVGVYSTPALWKRVVGDLALGVPEWRAAGQTSRAEARRRCATDWMIQGGTAVLSQWVEASRDQNITCKGTAVRMGVWFKQY